MSKLKREKNNEKDILMSIYMMLDSRFQKALDVKDHKEMLTIYLEMEQLEEEMKSLI